ncbi:MAG: glycosyltransferase family 4 protein [Alphaproteobacteria bacterium]
MRVLILSHGHPSFSIGGGEVASYNLHQGLNDLPDCESHYLARVGPPVKPHAGTPFLSLRQKARETLYYTNDYDYFRLSNRNVESLARDFSRYLRDVKPDIVHFHHILGYGVEAIHAVRRVVPKAAIVLTLHEYLSICNNHGQMVKLNGGQLCSRASPAECNGCFPNISAASFMKRELFLKSFYDQVDMFVSPSRFLVERYADWGLPRERLQMLENGLEIGEIAPPRPVGPGGRRNRFAYFGQLNQFKGIRVLIEAVSRVPAKDWGSDSALYVFGGNIEKQPEAFQNEFRRYVQAAGRRVRFFGSYQAQDLPRLMQGIDWVVMPSTWWENSPVVIQEAYLHGRPLICSDIGGMAEKVKDGVTGLHFRAGSAESLVDRLVEVLRNPGLWDRLQGRIKRPLSAREAAMQHRALYREILERRNGAKPARDRSASTSAAAAAVAAE